MSTTDRSSAIPPATEPTEPMDATGRSIEARLARLHLRTGALGLARAELETLAGAGDLDSDALLDLAEVRWRTGDLPGAGTAAHAYLAAGGDEALGFVIAAEAAVALGRPGEAKRLATRALERLDVPLDQLFAGIGRSAVWPTDLADPGEPAGALFAADAATSTARLAHSRSGGAAPAPTVDSAPASGPGLWDVESAALSDDLQPADPGAELAAGRAAIAAGDLEAAAVHLAIALRLDPALAPALLDVAAGHVAPGLALVRGDAYRLVGHELEARRAYASAARLLARRETIPGTEAPGSPASPSSAGMPAVPASGRATRPPAQAPARPTTARPARPVRPTSPPRETT